MALLSCDCVKGLPIEDILANIYCAAFTLATEGGGGLPDQTGHAGEFLTTDGTNASWAALAGGGDVVASGALTNNALIIGQGGTTVAATTTGTGVLTALGVNVGSAGAFVTLNGAGGTPSSIALANGTGLPIGTGVSGLGTNVATALAVNVGTAGAFVVNGGALGTPSSGSAANLTGYKLDNIAAPSGNATIVVGTTTTTLTSTLDGGSVFVIQNADADIAADTFLLDLGFVDTADANAWYARFRNTISGTPVEDYKLTSTAFTIGSGISTTFNGAVFCNSTLNATSPTFTTSIVAGGATMALLNTVATTVNAFGAATTINMGTSATVLNFGGGATAAELRFLEPSGSGTNYTAFKAVAQGANITYSLPATVGGAGTFLTDVAGDGVLSWGSPAGGGNVTAGGTLTSNELVIGQGTTAVAVTTTGTGILTFLGTPSSANLAAAVTDETGSGALVFGTSPGFTTAANPVSNDGAALGTTALGWADLHLATGALINVANGNAVITHSSGIFTVSTGDFRVTTAGTNSASAVTVGGAQTLTSKVLTSATITTGLTPTTNDGAALGSTANQFSDLFLAEGGVINWDNGDATLTQAGNVVTLAGADFVADNVTVNTALLPDANDGAALGSTTLQFSDLFLAEGGVINWDNGDATLTQSGNTLTVAGAEFIIDPASGPTSVSAGGFRGIPQNSQSAAYTTVLADAGKHILHPTADNNARTFTIDSNANVAYPIGTAITFINQINTLSIAITSDTLTLFAGSGTGTTGTRTLAAGGTATAVKVASTSWIISGIGLT